MSALLALLSSVIWGASDYLGGTTARRMHVTQLILIGQACALGLLVIVVIVSGSWRDADAIGWGIGAGLVGPFALGAFYTALSQGTMGVVAPIASCGVLVPVAAGLARGEHPGPLQLAGIAITVVGIVLAAKAIGVGSTTTGAARSADETADQEKADQAAAQRQSILLAVASAAGFGAVILFVAEGSSTSPLTTLTTQRGVNVVIVSAAVLLFRPTLTWARQGLVLAALTGIGDAAANTTFAFASRGGLVSVTATLASLYPVVTVLLARRLDGERLSSTQAAGVATTLAGVIMLAAG